jgi:hypothetical protein
VCQGGWLATRFSLLRVLVRHRQKLHKVTDVQAGAHLGSCQQQASLPVAATPHTPGDRELLFGSAALLLLVPPAESLAWRIKVSADTALEHPLEPRLMQLVRECRPSSYIGFDSQVGLTVQGRCGPFQGVGC